MCMPSQKIGGGLLCDILADFAKAAPNNCYFMENSLPTIRNSPSWVTLRIGKKKKKSIGDFKDKQKNERVNSVEFY